MEIENIRHKADNPYNYTDEEMIERTRITKEQHALYPHMPLAWVEYVYDYVKNTPEEELEEAKKLHTKSTRVIPNPSSLPQAVPPPPHDSVA